MLPEITLSHLHYFANNFIPIIIIIIYLFAKFFKIPEELFLIIPGAISVFTISTLNAFYKGITENIFFSFEWRYEVAFIYIIYFFVNWIFFYHKTTSFKTASIMTALTTLGIGWLYEVPRYLTSPEWFRAFWHSTFPFLVSSRMIGMIFFFMILGDLNWKFSRKTRIGIILFTVFSLAWMVKIFYFPFMPRTPFKLFMYRIPAMIMMITIPLDIKKERMQ